MLVVQNARAEIAAIRSAMGGQQGHGQDCGCGRAQKMWGPCACCEVRRTCSVCVACKIVVPMRWIHLRHAGAPRSAAGSIPCVPLSARAKKCWACASSSRRGGPSPRSWPAEWQCKCAASTRIAPERQGQKRARYNRARIGPGPPKSSRRRPGSARGAVAMADPA